MTALLLRKTGRQERRRSGLRPQCGDLSGTGDRHHGEPFAAPEHRALSGVSQHVSRFPGRPAAQYETLTRLELENGSHIISLPGPERTIRGLASVFDRFRRGGARSTTSCLQPSVRCSRLAMAASSPYRPRPESGDGFTSNGYAGSGGTGFGTAGAARELSVCLLRRLRGGFCSGANKLGEQGVLRVMSGHPLDSAQSPEVEPFRPTRRRSLRSLPSQPWADRQARVQRRLTRAGCAARPGTPRRNPSARPVARPRRRARGARRRFDPERHRLPQPAG
jgi:hypothetical protein